ncbi:hypothetical protein CC1G_01291 [Coprinopsis cinerea okayama7|uniref:Pentatricopeptide repeat-containing protein n=1 Tax=Coprinopsis cinerea (strain Okayama-7 / 130 / ATCC MYA-4618 / FGSC 9003) TaxID=240176 RepID=A8NYA1_COPC7|nr:hypothetical protein CC1G_01291 [Coprinopsis cinerea okayama7\|eukprot:XP_001837379.2 hypothetical protein CC1G_01291 [Coprinopsis cinerea okayama7\
MSIPKNRLPYSQKVGNLRSIGEEQPAGVPKNPSQYTSYTTNPASGKEDHASYALPTTWRPPTPFNPERRVSESDTTTDPALPSPLSSADMERVVREAAKPKRKAARYRERRPRPGLRRRVKLSNPIRRKRPPRKPKDNGQMDPTQCGSQYLSPTRLTLRTFVPPDMEGGRGPTLVRLLRAMLSKDLQKALEAQNEIRRLQAEDHVVSTHFSRIPVPILRQLHYNLSKQRPVTKSHFPLMLSALQSLWDAGETFPIDVWNSLINVAGKGFRTGSRHEYVTAASIYRDMISGRRPGASQREFLNLRKPEQLEALPGTVQPNLVTFNTLISIAARSLSQPAIAHAVALFQKSGLTPDHITHSSLLVYFTRTNNFTGIRNTLLKMKRQKLSMPIDTLNGILYAYIYNGRAEVAWDAFLVLKNNVTPDPNQAFVKRAQRRLASKEGIVIGSDLKPNEVTYVATIQAMAHKGDAFRTFSTLHEHLSLDPGAFCWNSTAAAFRAVFLGFSKHAHPPSFSTGKGAVPIYEWNLSNLDLMFKLFLRLPPTRIPTRSTIYWIITAFDKASGGDLPIQRRVWVQLKLRFQKRDPQLFRQKRLQDVEARLFLAPQSQQCSENPSSLRPEGASESGP